VIIALTFYVVYAKLNDVTNMDHTLTPLPKGRDESEDTQVELVLSEHSCEQVELKAVLSFCCTCYFQHILASLKIKEHHQNPLILCVLTLKQV